MGRPKGSKNGVRSGLEYRRVYHCWRDMNRRCHDERSLRYEQYGGRGIVVCNEWRTDFWAFHDWALSNGYADTLTLERVNVAVGYSPDNCKWIPLAEQALNTSRSKLLVAFDEAKSMAAWAKDSRCKVGYYTLRSRVRYGWDTEHALTEEVG